MKKKYLVVLIMGISLIGGTFLKGTNLKKTLSKQEKATVALAKLLQSNRERIKSLQQRILHLEKNQRNRTNAH